MNAEDFIRTTCPRDCYDGCGIKIQRRDDRTLNVVGDPDHPVSRGSICQKCAIGYNTSWQDPNFRLLHPASRTGAKGTGQFRPITWNEALSEVAEKLNLIRERYGGAAITNVHYTGTCSLLAGRFPLRFFQRIGAVEFDGDTICNKAGHVGLSYMFGSSRHGFDPRAIQDANCLVIWGCNPSHSSPRTFSLIQSKGIKTIVIDPIRHDTARNSTIHLRPQPGSDAALAFGMLHIVLQKGREDRDFIEKHVVGFKDVVGQIQSCTPAWTEAQTGVPAQQIQEAVELYLEGPSLLWLGQGLQRQPMGGNAIRSCALLPILTGNLGKPGTGFCFLNDTEAMAQNRDPDANSCDHDKLSHMDLADHLADPNVRCLFVWNMNPAISGPRQHDLQRALEREDLFTVVIDCFRSKTTQYADILLPAATFLEFDDFVWNYFHLLLGFQAKAAEPMGSALPNQEIFRRLARAMNLDDQILFEPDRRIIEDSLAKLVPSIKLEDLKSKGWIEIGTDARTQFASLVFPTSSGKIEVASTKAFQEGHSRCPFPHADTNEDAEGTFRLLSPASKWTLNSIFRDNPKIAKLADFNTVVVHPGDASLLEVRNGDELDLSNAYGHVILKVLISDVTIKGVLLTHKTALSLRQPEIGINALNSGKKTDMGESSSVHGVRVVAKRCINT